MQKITNDLLNVLRGQALNIRIDSVKATTASQSGHPTSCLSAADLISVLFFHELNHNLEHPKDPNNDRFIMSKGHAIPVVYAAYKNLGVIDEEELLSLRKFDSVLEGHPTPRFMYNEAATGSLGQGLSIGLGMALNARLDKLSYRTFVMMGDGEISEGSIWEAAELASHYKVDNLVGIVDCNRLAQSGSSLHDHGVEKYAKKFEAFGWKTFVIDGHNIEAIVNAFDKIKQVKDQPSVIIAKTYKGHGLSIENRNGYHGKPFKHEHLDEIIDELKTTFADELPYIHHHPQHIHEENRFKQEKHKVITLDITNDAQNNLFTKGNHLATRKAFGYALTALGRENNQVVALDADVKNSTFTEIFEQEFPDRFIQCFIAEQNMISIATGLQARGKIPFSATFAAFFSRAYDQIRMAGIGRNALRLCGSHAGVSIGADGPSQMGLEDIALMRCVPNSIVLYPSDAVSTYKLTELMANYHEGISYLRTTREATPILYNQHETFTIGGCKVIHQSDHDRICIIGAGITLHEALKAYKLLQLDGIHVSVIDLYSVKPLDATTIRSIAKSSGNKIITVEDHYLEGGIGEAITHAVVNNNITVKSLAVGHISRSGEPDELLAFAGIDADAIIEAVHEMI